VQLCINILQITEVQLIGLHCAHVILCGNDRFLNGVGKHPDLQTDPSFVDFLEVDSDLPRATSTSALSGAGVLRLFSRVGDSLGKIAYKMDESDPVIIFVCIAPS